MTDNQDLATKHDVEAAPAIDHLVDTTYNLVKERLGDINVGSSTLLTILRVVMEVVEGSEITGSERKQLAITLIKKLVEAAGLGAEELALCTSMIDGGIIANTIDLIIDASRGRLEINTAVRTATSCCLSFITYLRTKYNKRRTKASIQG